MGSDGVIKGVPTVVTEDGSEVVVLAAGVGVRVLARGEVDGAPSRQQQIPFCSGFCESGSLNRWRFE